MISAAHATCDVATAHAIATASTTERPRLLIATTILASSLAFIDGSVVNVGLPAIGTTFAAGASELQWVVNAYLLPAQRSSSSRRRSRRHLWSTEDVDHRCNPVRVGIPGMRNGAKHSVLVGGAPGAGCERRFIDAEQSGDFGNGLLRRGKGSGDRSLGSRRRWCGGDWPGARWMADRLRIVAADLPD